MPVVFKTKLKEYSIENNSKETIINLARKTGIFIKTGCGGKGKCGNCIVNLGKGHYYINKEEVLIKNNNYRKALSCMTKIAGNDAIINIPDNSIIESTGKITDDFILKKFKNNPHTKKILLTIPHSSIENQASDSQRLKNELYKKTNIQNTIMPLDVLKKLPEALMDGNQKITVTLGRVRNIWFMIDIEKSDTSGVLYSIAIDIGTTTVVGILINLLNGEILGRASFYNQQIKIGDEVISRIAYCRSQIEVDDLKTIIINDTINPIIQELCKESKIKPADIKRASVSGNTTMSHLFLGLNPSGIGKVPFQPVTKTYGEFLGKELGIDIMKNGIVDIIPSVSGYIGGDIVSDIHASKLYKKKKLTILIDIGTNGEIVMCENQKMIACSTAAGPAFEGYGLYNGCRASNGAIEKIFFDRENNLHTEIIGNGKASGICGTGYIDFIAEGFRIGLINQFGKFNDALLERLGLSCSVKIDKNNIKSCIILGKDKSISNEPIIITELDISKIILAKAAIYAGLNTLLFIKNKKPDDVKKIILAGGFARHLDITNAITMGLLPDIPKRCYEIIGNGSLAGAYLAMIEKDALDEMTAIVNKPEVIELNMRKEFKQYYFDALRLPSTE